MLDQLQFGEMMVLYSGESVACSMDEGFDFEANHHFFYLTGLRRENMALVLANTHRPAHVILFIEEPIPDMERWTGRRVTIDAVSYTHLDNDFHRLLFHIAQKDNTMRMLEGMTIHFDRVRALALTVVKDQKVIDDHRQICDAIERRDVAAAQEIMTKHLTRVKVDEASIRQACPEYIKT